MVPSCSEVNKCLSAQNGILSRFNAVSNTTSPSPKPIRCRNSKSGEHDHALLPSHSRKQQTSEDECQNRKRCSAWQSKSCSSGLLPSQGRQCRRHCSVQEQSRQRRKRRIPSEIAGDGKCQQQHCKCQDRNVWSSKPRMNRREKSREISPLSHRKRHPRRMQHVRAQVAVH